MYAVSFDEEYRFACSDYGEEYFVAETVGRREEVIVPFAARIVAVFDPYGASFASCGGKLEVVGNVDECAVGT